MAHFAQLDGHNIVQQVIVISNKELLNNEHESEEKGIAFCKSLFGGTWVQTSYNGNFRKNFAGIGYSYDSVRDAFIPPKPFNSWVLDESTCQWHSPVPKPADGKIYTWNETTKTWVST